MKYVFAPMCSIKYIVSFLVAVNVIISVLYAQEAASWVDFCTKNKTGDFQNSVLLDYSYSGYHFSEKQIPDVSKWNTLSVVNFGATPNDETFDDAAIQATINAAEASGKPTVVYFPAGKYKVSSDATKDLPIEINKSHIVLKGAGSGIGGTEIYAVKFGDITKKFNTPWRFIFVPSSSSATKIATIKKNIKRGDKTIEVTDASSIRAGMLVRIDHQGKSNLELNMPGLQYNPKWTTINERGLKVIEKHLVTKVEGNKITFKNPVNYNVPLNGDYANLKRYVPIEEVGVEDILFTSAWKEHPEDYVHHANDIVDYAWRAIRFDKVYNGWIQNVKFRDWNDCIQIKESFAVTVRNVEISGKQGHASFMADACTGVLFEDCKDLVTVGFNDAGGQGHGPGFQYYSTACVYRNMQMQNHQSVDCHGYQPYGNLFDNVYGGCFRGNGGSESAYPNSGPDLVFWNFVHASNFTSKEFSFWDANQRLLHIYAKPKFVGFTSPGENISFKYHGLDESHGKQVYPKSLFEAQLQLRLYNAYASASSEKIGFEALHLIDNDNNNYWSPAEASVGSFLMLDFGTDKPINTISFIEAEKAITNFSLYYWQNSNWEKLTPTVSEKDNNKWIFNKVTTRKIKFMIEAVDGEKVVKVSALSALLDNSILPAATIKFTTGDVILTEGYHLELETIIANEGADLNKVDLYIDDQLIRSANVAPFKWGHSASPNPTELDGLSTGVYRFTAKAIDMNGHLSEDYLTINVENQSATVIEQKENTLNQKFTIFPNPNNGSFTIQMDQNVTGLYSVYNLIGKKINQGVAHNNKQIHLYDVPKGLYLIKIECPNFSRTDKILIR